MNSICSAREMAIIADECSSISRWTEAARELRGESRRADVYAERSLQDFRAAADEGRLADRQRASTMESEAVARLEVIADTYLSVNAPCNWRCPNFSSSATLSSNR